MTDLPSNGSGGERVTFHPIIQTSSRPSIEAALMVCRQCGMTMVRGTQCKRCGAWCR